MVSESKFPLVEKLGLRVIHAFAFAVGKHSSDGPGYVGADELEQLLAQAPVAYGRPPSDGIVDLGWNFSVDDMSDTHSARLIMIEPLKRPKVKISEILAALRTACRPSCSENDHLFMELSKRIEREGIEDNGR